MRWRTVLIDVPARICDIWFRAYWLIVFLLTSFCILTGALSLALYFVGIRWGW